jgi:hypothetical protein
MHLFGRDDEPHLVHFEAHRMPHYVTLTWDVRHAPALSWRVVRSETGFAAEAGDDAIVGSGQTLVCESGVPGARDDDVTADAVYYYTIFSNDGHGQWERQLNARVEPDDHFRVDRTECDFEEGSPADGYLDVHEIERMRALHIGAARGGKFSGPGWVFKAHRIPMDV